MVDQFKTYLRDNPKIGLVLILAIALPVLVFISQQVTRYRSRADTTPAYICLTTYPCTTPPTYSITATETLVPVWVNASSGNISGVDMVVDFDQTKVRLAREVVFYPNPDPQGTNRLQPLIITPLSEANTTGRIRISVAAVSFTNLPPNPVKIAALPFVAASASTSTDGLDVIVSEIVGFVNGVSTIYTPSVTNPAATLTTGSIVPTTGSSQITGTLFLDPVTVSRTAGGSIFPVAIKFRTGNSSSTAQAISAISLRITYPYSSTSPILDIVNPTTGASTNQISPNSVLQSSQDWTFQVNQVTRSGSSGQVTIDLGAINTSTTGFSTFTDTTLATIYFKAASLPSPNPVTLSWNTTETRMLTKNEPIINILNPLANGSITIISTTIPTPVPPTPVPTTPTPTPVPPTSVPLTPTPVAQTGSLSYGFKMQAVTFAGILRSSTLNLGSSTTNQSFTVPVTSNAQSVFSPTSPVTLTGVPVYSSGSLYSVYAKAPGYLKKLLGDIVLFPGSNIGPTSWNDKVLRAGDFTIQGVNDNKLTINDIGAILSAYTQLSVPVSTANSQYDLDANSVINIVDIAQVLTNFTCIEVYGDPAPVPLPLNTCLQR